MKTEVVQVNPNSIFIDVLKCDACKGDHDNIKARPHLSEKTDKPSTTKYWFKCDKKLIRVDCKPNQEEMEAVEKKQNKKQKKDKKKDKE